MQKSREAAFLHCLPRQFDTASVEIHCNEIEGRKIRSSATNETRPMQSDELDAEDISAFFSIGYTHHREIIRFCKTLD